MSHTEVVCTVEKTYIGPAIDDVDLDDVKEKVDRLDADYRNIPYSKIGQPGWGGADVDIRPGSDTIYVQSNVGNPTLDFLLDLRTAVENGSKMRVTEMTIIAV